LNEKNFVVVDLNEKNFVVVDLNEKNFVVVDFDCGSSVGSYGNNGCSQDLHVWSTFFSNC